MAGSSSLISFPLRSTVALETVPLNLNGGWYWFQTGEPVSAPQTMPPAMPR